MLFTPLSLTRLLHRCTYHHVTLFTNATTLKEPTTITYQLNYQHMIRFLKNKNSATIDFHNVETTFFSHTTTPIYILNGALIVVLFALG